MIAPAILFAIAALESGCNAVALSPEGQHWGMMQIGQSVLDDVNRTHKTQWTRHSCMNPNLAYLIAAAYLKIYATPERLGRDPEVRDYALIWRFGPNGWRRRDALAIDYGDRAEAIFNLLTGRSAAVPRFRQNEPGLIGRLVQKGRKVLRGNGPPKPATASDGKCQTHPAQGAEP